MAFYEFGPSGYGGGSYFHETVNDGEHVSKILVRSGEWIDSIQLVANGRHLERHGGSGGSERQLVLDPTERILEIRGDVIFGVSGGFYIGRLKIITESQTFTAGVRGGIPFRYPIPKSVKLCGLWGRSATYLDYIGIICRD